MFDQAVQHIYVGNGHAPVELGDATFVFYSLDISYWRLSSQKINKCIYTVIYR